MVLRRVIFIQAATIAAFILIMFFHISSAEKCLRGTDSSKTDYVSGPERCYNFSVLNREKGEFYSPNYPNPYPNNTKCTLQIAADYGHLVQIDFLDSFKIENTPNCDFDRLVVRDGPYGYSRCIGVFCGDKHPPKITSTSRYLWLQFISDGTIQESGFRAVYRFQPFSKGTHLPPTEECLFHREGPSGEIGLSDITETIMAYTDEYNTPVDCKWQITARPGWKIYMTIPEFQLSKPNNCDVNYVEIFDGNQDERSLAKFCGTSAEPQKTKTNVVFIRFFYHRITDNDKEKGKDKKKKDEPKFSLTYTTIRDLDKTEKCDLRTEFDCNDQSCIDKIVVCDERTDCKYNNDEDPVMCKKEIHSETSNHMIIILVVFFILVITMCASISVSCYNKVKDRQQREREYKARRSKEASVEGTVDRTVAGNPDRLLEAALASQVAKIVGSSQRPAAAPHMMDDDDESSDGCHVPEVDLSGFQKHPNGGESIPRGLDSRSVSRSTTQPDIHRQEYPYMSHSIDSLQSDTLIAPAPPPVPMHLKERREASQQPGYRHVGGRAVAEVNKQTPSERRFEPYVKQPKESLARTPTDTSRSPSRVQSKWPPESRQGQARNVPEERPPGPGPGKGVGDPDAPRNAFLRGPLEAGVPRSGYTRNPAEIGLPKFGTARVNPDGPRGPLGSRTERATPLATFKTPESYADNPYTRGNRSNPYRNYRANPQEEIAAPQQFRTQAMVDNSEIDSRPDSVDSTQSAPDVIANR